jgi:hypothetical protein
VVLVGAVDQFVAPIDIFSSGGLDQRGQVYGWNYFVYVILCVAHDVIIDIVVFIIHLMKFCHYRTVTVLCYAIPLMHVINTQTPHE